MRDDLIYTSLINIFGSRCVSNDPKELMDYSNDMSFYEGRVPKFVVYPSKVRQIEEVLKLANILRFSIIPISNNFRFKHHGDSIPRNDNSIILNLSNMKKILSIDRKNRVVMVEPGVTFGELIPKLKEKGLRLLTPLTPTASKSVLTAALEREPIIIPRYHWDGSDPLLCTEVVFGTGDLFRTGTAAGPGTIKQQQKAGQAQVNPMGPTQFSPFRVIQGAQGSLGVVTWATLKLELSPTNQKVYHIQSKNIQDVLDFQYELLKFRLCDELLILNNLNLACLLKNRSNEILELSENLGKWNLIFVISGRGPLANDKISYLEGDVDEIRAGISNKLQNSDTVISDREILNTLSEPCDFPWRARFKGAYQDIFFLTSFEKISKFISMIEAQYAKDLGVYIQPINQGTAYHVEFDINYDPEDQKVINRVKEKTLDLSLQLIESGAFFSRPYGLWAKEVYAHHNTEIIDALKKVKKIFDPNNVLNPGILCFEK
jgi:hypothetical protein